MKLVSKSNIEQLTKGSKLNQIRQNPFYILISSLAATLLLAGFFLPTLSVSLFSINKIQMSFFQVLLNRYMGVSIQGNRYVASFDDAIPFVVAAFILPILILVLVFFRHKLVAKLPDRALSGTLLGLFLLNLAALFQASSKLISTPFLTEVGLGSNDLFFSFTTWGNWMILLSIAAILFMIWAVSGLKIQIRMLSYPYILWLGLFTILPLILIFFAAFFTRNSDGGFQFTLDGFKTLFVDRIIEVRFYGLTLHLQEYFSVFLRSLDYAIWTAIGCLLIAYPLAYVLAARAKRTHTSSSLLLMFFVLPMWINTMLRTYAWRAFFGQTGVLNNFLLNMHWISQPIPFLKLDFLADFIIKFVLVNDFLPFMLLPIYAVLLKLDENVRQAAHDLGANSRQTFSKVIFPLSMPGVISGIQMVFMPALTFFMIPEIMSEGSVTTIGTTVQTFILSENAVHRQAGNVLSLLLLIFVLITMGILRNSDRDTGGGGMIL